MANAKNLETVKLNKNSMSRRFLVKAEGMHLLTASEKRPKMDRTESEKKAWAKKREGMDTCRTNAAEAVQPTEKET